MNMFKKRITLLNIISNIILQFVNILSWFIIPKIILSYFGSSVNGLVSSISQFLSYISLVEGGVTSVVMACLYKPLISKDQKKISSIMKTSQLFYRKIGLIFIAYSFILAIIYPVVVNTGYSYLYVFTLVIILSFSLMIQYMYSLTYRNLLNASKKVYIISFTQSLILILTIILSYISVKIYPNIHFLKIISGLLFILQPVIYSKYINKSFDIDFNAVEDKHLIKQRWNGFAINIAAFIHNCTDVSLLTFFTNLATVSIYSVYAIVTNGLRAIINAISSAIVPTIGITYASENDNKLNKKMDIYEYVVFIAVYFSFTIAGLLITPFVMIYTKDITDANYFQPLFGILMIISEALYLLKMPHLNLAYSANKFKELSKYAYIEATINIVVSVCLVYNYGLIGVTIGTIVAMIYRMITQVHFTKRLIKSRNVATYYKKIFIFSVTTIIGVVICALLIPSAKFNIISWITNGMIYSAIFGILYLVMSIIFFNDELNYIKKYLKH